MRALQGFLASLMTAAVCGSRSELEVDEQVDEVFNFTEVLAAAGRTRTESPENCANILLALSETEGEARTAAFRAAFGGVMLAGGGDAAGHLVGQGLEACRSGKQAIEVASTTTEVLVAPGVKSAATFRIGGQNFGISYNERGEPEADNLKLAVQATGQTAGAVGVGVLALVAGAFLAPITGGASLPVAAASAASMAGGCATVATAAGAVGVGSSLIQMGLAQASAADLAAYFAEHCSYLLVAE